MFSLVHIGNNKWNYYYDNDVYPKFISEISNCFEELLLSKILNRNIINKFIDFLDYMADEGYCNNEDINEDIKKKYKMQIQKTKLLIYNLKNLV
jgi:hypothetical protein